MKSEATADVGGLVTDTRIHRRIYLDQGIFDQEMERIWYRTWLLVGHESEIAKPGDFKSTHLGRKPVIMCRDEAGRVRVLLNSCRHRGAMVCRERSGNRKVFQCMYHAWAYKLDGSLSSVPSMEGYGGKLDKKEFALWSLPRVASYRGIVFASFNPDAPPLEDYLGGAKRYIDIALGSSEGGEVIGVHEYDYSGNWKLHQENTVDGYHPRYLHRMFAQSGMWTGGEAYDLGNGHGVLSWRTGVAKGETGSLMGLDASDTTLETSRALIVFPNMVLVHIQDLINLRQTIPIAPGKTRIFAAALGLCGEPQEVRMRRAIQLSAAQGPAGIAGADDIELFEAAQEGFAAGVDEVPWLDMSRGSFRNADVGDLEDEVAVRGYYREWRRMMAINGTGGHQ